MRGVIGVREEKAEGGRGGRKGLPGPTGGRRGLPSPTGEGEGGEWGEGVSRP